MSRILAMLALSCLTATAAHAELRLINTTGKALVVDVLSADKQQRDIKLPADGSLSDVLGTAYSDHNASNEMVVIRDEAGKELLREKHQTNSIFLITNWGDGLSTTWAGRYTGKSSTIDDGVTIINVTGKQLGYSTENADFSVNKGKGREPNDRHAGTVTNIKMPGEAGGEQKLTLTIAGAAPLEGTVLRGSMYILRLDGETLKIKRVE